MTSRAMPLRGWAALALALGPSLFACAHARVSAPPPSLREAAPHPYAAASRVPTPALGERVARVAAAFRSVGARPFEEVTAAFLTREGASVWRVRAARDGCIGAVGLAHRGFEALELEVFNPVGIRLAHDGPAGAHPYARLCPHAGETLYFSLRAGRISDGEVALLTMADPPVTPPDIDAALGQRSTATFSPPPAAHIDLGNDPTRWEPRGALASTENRYIANGFTPLSVPRGAPVLEGELDHGREEQRALHLRAGHCYLIAGAAGPGVSALDLRIVSPDNDVLDRDSREQPRPVLRVCADDEGDYTLIVRVERGAGTWAATVFERRQEPALEQVDGPPALRGVAEELFAEARRGAFTLVGAPQRLLTPGNASAWSGFFPVRAGRCYLFAIAATANAGALESSLENADGLVLSADSAGFLASRLFYCAHNGGAVRWRVAGGGRGDVALMQFESATSGEAR